MFSLIRSSFFILWQGMFWLVGESNPNKDKVEFNLFEQFLDGFKLRLFLVKLTCFKLSSDPFGSTLLVKIIMSNPDECKEVQWQPFCRDPCALFIAHSPFEVSGIKHMPITMLTRKFNRINIIFHVLFSLLKSWDSSEHGLIYPCLWFGLGGVTGSNASL